MPRAAASGEVDKQRTGEQNFRGGECGAKKFEAKIKNRFGAS